MEFYRVLVELGLDYRTKKRGNGEVSNSSRGYKHNCKGLDREKTQKRENNMRANIGPVEKGGISSPRFGTEEQPKINFSGLHSLSLPFFF